MTREEGEAFAAEHGLVFTEASAMVDTNVTEAFHKVGETIMKKLTDGTIDPSIDEYGVKKAGKELMNFDEYDELLKKSKKKKGKCKC